MIIIIYIYNYIYMYNYIYIIIYIHMYSCFRYNSSKSSVLVLNCLTIPRPKKNDALTTKPIGRKFPKYSSIAKSVSPILRNCMAWTKKLDNRFRTSLDLLNLDHQTKHRLMHFNVAEQHLGPMGKREVETRLLTWYTVHVGVVVPKSPK